jgi:hypothetical protein
VVEKTMTIVSSFHDASRSGARCPPHKSATF